MPPLRGDKSRKKTRRYKRDIDQAHADLRSPRHLEQYQETKAEEDLPAAGEHYCVECARWFDTANNIEAHRKEKTHKKRVRDLKETPYSHKEADAVAGLNTDAFKRHIDKENVDKMDEDKTTAAA